MSENDFFVAIQAILEKARQDGWTVEKVVDKTYEAVNEFEEEHGDEADEYEYEP